MSLPKTDPDKNKTAYTSYDTRKEKKSHGLAKVHNENYAKKKKWAVIIYLFSDDFGSRSPIIPKNIFISQEKCYL